jgi:peptide/nickel transport system substrate-binding protein
MLPTTVRRLLSALVVCAVAWMSAPSAAELRIGVAADVTSIDPHFFNLFPNNNIAEHIFDKLVRMDPDSQMIPGLETSCKTIDQMRWEFKVR